VYRITPFILENIFRNIYIYMHRKSLKLKQQIKQGVVVYACNHSTREAKAGGLQVPSHPEYT
jgi:hypothetical protein